MKRLMCRSVFVLGVLAGASCAAQVTVLEGPDSAAKPVEFRDPQFHVGFSVPAGWEFTTRDGEVSSFHADVEKVPAEFELRGVASMNFNPFPASTLGGAMFYFSVGPKIPEDACLKGNLPENQHKVKKIDRQDIGGMKFVHVHGEGGEICTEVRDEVYTAYRKGACYRFDLKINTFCAVSSGAQEINDQELEDIVKRMTGILSTVELGWEKSGPHFVPAPPLTPVAPTPIVPVIPVRPGVVGQLGSSL